MRKFVTYIPVLAMAVLSSCYTPDSLKGFDSDTWKGDTYACTGKRTELVSDFEKIRKELYGKKEYVLRNLLGKPDSEELLERNQRIYYYYIEPGAQCTDRSRLSEANRIEVHINALGKVSEVNYYQPFNAKKPG